MVIKLISEVFPLIIWLAILSLGGLWIIRKAFKIRKKEELIIGFSFGLFFQTWLVNIFARFLSMQFAIWIAASTVFVIGFICVFPQNIKEIKNLIKFRISFYQWISLFALTFVFFSINRGMAILDEFQTLPLVSQMAAGDIPPHFPLDPNVIYNYHYFPYLMAAQFMRLADLFPWTALDLMHAFILSLSTILIVLWVKKITRNRVAGVFAGAFNFFAGGTRWLLLFLPESFINTIDINISRIGSGLHSGENLLEALTNPWAAQGTGPFEIPFAYANGFNAANSVGLGYTNFVVFFISFFLLTYQRKKNWLALGVYFVMLAALDLTHEVTLLFLAAGTIFSIVFQLVKNHGRKLHSDYLNWLIILCLIGLLSLFQGGIITGAAQNVFQKFISSSNNKELFHTLSLKINCTPVIIDSHLGQLELIKPIHLLLFFIEVGPLIFFLPALSMWGIKAIRSGRWFEGFFLGISISSMILIFFSIDFKGSSIGAFTRAQNYYLILIKFIAIPFLFIYLRSKNDFRKTLIYGLIFMSMFGGITIFGVEMIAAKEPILTIGLNELDARIMKEYWNTLEPNELVFDPERFRAAVLFGKPTDSSIDWFTNKPMWEKLAKKPDPNEIYKNGFSHMYYDDYYIRSLEPDIRPLLEDDCVIILREYEDYRWGMRRLVDLRQCNG